jgi:hypothetical protein
MSIGASTQLRAMERIGSVDGWLPQDEQRCLASRPMRIGWYCGDHPAGGDLVIPQPQPTQPARRRG